MASKTRRSASGPIACRQRGLDEDAVVRVAAIQPLDQLQKLRQRRRRRQPLEVGAEARLPGRLQLAADVDFRRRIVADEHDAEARRPARSGS